MCEYMRVDVRWRVLCVRTRRARMCAREMPLLTVTARAKVIESGDELNNGGGRLQPNAASGSNRGLLQRRVENKRVEREGLVSDTRALLKVG